MDKKLISIAGLIGSSVYHKGDQEVGKLVDLVFRWNTEESYPPLSGILVRVGRRTSWISAQEIIEVTRGFIRLRTAKLDLRDFEKREGEVRIAQDVLDHQMVDVNGARVVRAADLYIAVSRGITRLVGVDVSYASLIRRLGPASLRRRPPATGSVIDWSAIQSFGGQLGSGGGLKLGASRSELHSLRPSELADLLEDLGRDERQELMEALEPEEVADALEEMQAEELEGILRESEPEQAAEYLANMEPDEAADALRDVDEELREDLLSLMPEKSSDQVEEVLSHDEDEAGGFMTTALFTTSLGETVRSVQERLAKSDDDFSELDAIAVVDSQGRLVQDLPIVRLFLAKPSQPVDELFDDDAPITVSPDATVDRVAKLLIDNRRSSVLVVNEDNLPIGRILADDVVDALMPEKKRFRLSRLLS
jgi:predicted transcriptional regulator